MLIDAFPFLSRRTFRLLFLLNLVLIVVTSLLPSATPTVWHFDKVGHFVAYGLLFTLALFSFQSLSARLAIFLISAFMGIVIEWLQSFVPGRHMSIGDAISNVAGLLFGILVYRSIIAFMGIYSRDP